MRSCARRRRALFGKQRMEPGMGIPGPKALKRWDSALPVFIGGADLLADSSGVAFWPAHHAAGLRSSPGERLRLRATRRVPATLRAQTLIRLAKAITLHEVRRVIALGDSFHSAQAVDGLDGAQSTRLPRFKPGASGSGLPGTTIEQFRKRRRRDVCGELILDGIALRHTPAAFTGAGEIAGHLHPAARLALNGSVLRRRCFVSDARRMILPAFGALAGGLNILDKAFNDLFCAGSDTIDVHVLGNGHVFCGSPRFLISDRR